MLASDTAQLTDSEILLWTVLHNFEALALSQYEKFCSALATPEKKELVSLLFSRVPDNKAMENTSLDQPVKALLDAATSSSEKDTLLIQGLLLEVLGKTIYDTFKDSESFTAATHHLCSVGLKAQDSIGTKITTAIKERIGTAEQIYSAFIDISKPVILRLDALGESLDQHFSEQFDISFSDLMGSFVAELVLTCTNLGMERRKIVGYLTSALMGV